MAECGFLGDPGYGFDQDRRFGSGEAAQQNRDLLVGIATASRDQASSLSEVTSAVRQLDEMTQHNAALVEETNAAIEQTEAQAGELDKVVDVFAIGEAAPNAAPTRTSPSARAAIRPAGKRPLVEGNAAVDWTEF